MLYNFLFIVISAIISYIEKIGLEKEIILVSILALIQLIILGLTLKIIFSLGILFSFLLLTLMISAASYLVSKEVKIKNKSKLFLSLFLSYILTTTTVLFFLIISKTVSLTPSQIIPLAGMVIGNSMNTAHQTLETLIDKVKTEKEVFLGYIALGAREIIALKPFIRTAIRIALIPQINRTKSVGIIFIPGAMVGLILAGADPLYAAKIQVVIMWMIIYSSLVVSISICYLMHKDLAKV
ncbi:hypothetical protein J422_03923 [Methanocaldococcus villosus KIN24-T80]|uniref:ABC transporter permease n=1 Tax=Methanocaldococcus villosus KIN24-T80 TaxID=1069083 RepID=N6VSL9_9EURY|nr:iron export ABC transporter permease subunit FetB [Methanocaldococcus villosus]ENN96171.1 hypothetical protein J422_03923 [Methanocaldococcus villosus KIN24-T80]